MFYLTCRIVPRNEIHLKYSEVWKAAVHYRAILILIHGVKGHRRWCNCTLLKLIYMPRVRIALYIVAVDECTDDSRSVKSHDWDNHDNLFFQFLEDISLFGGATDTGVLDFWWVCPEFQNQGRSLACALYHLFAMDSSDSSLVPNLLTSWQTAWQLSLFDPCTGKGIQTLVEIQTGTKCVAQCVPNEPCQCKMPISPPCPSQCALARLTFQKIP